MGKSTLIIVLGYIMIFGMIQGDMNKITEKAFQGTAELYENIQANIVATSLAEYLVCRHIHYGLSDTTISNGTWLNSTVNADIDFHAHSSWSGFDTLLISCVSLCGNIPYTCRVSLNSRTLSIPPIFAAAGLFSALSIVSVDTIAQIIGNDTNMDGSDGDGTDLCGLSVSNSVDSSTVSNEHSGTNRIVGTGASPSISTHDMSSTDLQALADFYETVADSSYTGGNLPPGNYGTQLNPEIIHVDGDVHLTGNLNGYGILVVEGSFYTAENSGLIWHGVVIGVDSNTIEFDLGDSSTVFGSTLIGAPNNAGLNLTGTPADTTIEFIIEEGKITPQQDFTAHVLILGVAFESLPITAKVRISDEWFEPWGTYTSPSTANLNDGNQHSFYPPTEYAGGTSIGITCKSWFIFFGWEWEKMEVSSWDNSPNVIVLRDGEEIPDIEPFGEQADITDFLEYYIDSESGTVTLADNQVIYLFELWTTDPSDPAYDFQDLVALVSLFPVEEPEEGAEGDSVVIGLVDEIPTELIYSEEAIQMVMDMLNSGGYVTRSVKNIQWWE